MQILNNKRSYFTEKKEKYSIKDVTKKYNLKN